MNTSELSVSNGTLNVNKTLREEAMSWWNSVKNNNNDGFVKWKLAYKYFDRHWLSLTGREIEIIYKLECNIS